MSTFEIIVTNGTLEISEINVRFEIITFDGILQVADTIVRVTITFQSVQIH